MGKLTFRKEERLSREKWIRELFEKGRSLQFYPFRVIWLKHPDSQYPFNQVLISVSSRIFKNAADRNTIKRRVREAFRLNKSSIRTAGKWLIAYIYIAREILPSSLIHQKLSQTLEKLNTVHEQKN